MNAPAHRRVLPEASTRRGWCPGLARPMPTGDGLLARVHPPLGILSVAQARAVAEGARRFGNGHLDLTARANLQIRGVGEETRAPLARWLTEAGLGDRRADGGPQRLTLTSPLAGQDPAERIDVPALAQTIEAAALAIAGLPAKTLVVVEGRPDTATPEADCRVVARGAGRVAIAIAAADGMHPVADCATTEAPTVVAALLAAFARTGRRRIRDLSEDERTSLARVVIPAADGRDLQSGPAALLPLQAPRTSLPPLRGRVAPEGGRERGATVQNETLAFTKVTSLPAPALPSCETSSRPDTCSARATLPRKGGRQGARGSIVARLHRYANPAARRRGTAIPAASFAPAAGLRDSGTVQVLAIDAPFGRCTADALDRVAAAAEALGGATIRLSPTRGFVLVAPTGAQAAAVLAELAADFIVAPDDPRRSVEACTGAPGCASGSTPTLLDAGRVAAAFRPLSALGVAAHVSGCAKGCARPGPADLTLVARGGLYGVVIGGAPGDEPALHLPIEAVLDRLGRAKTVGLSAAFAPDMAGAGYGRNGRPA